MSSICDIRRYFCQAERCWRSNNLRACLDICESLNKSLRAGDIQQGDELSQIKNLLWVLQIKCLSEDYHLNESILLDDNDSQADEQTIRTISATSRRAGQNVAATSTTTTTSTRTQNSISRARVGTSRRTSMASGSIMDTRARQQGTGMLTGQASTRLSSRQSGRAASSYRPLTTSLTASQTAFSRSTRPLLKYSSSVYLSKLTYDYLYNAQKVTNKCPDYRQCLEYLNSVLELGATSRANERMQADGEFLAASKAKLRRQQGLDSREERSAKNLGSFWNISLGVCYSSLKMHKQAETNFKLALAANPKWLDPYLWLIKVYMRLNQPLDVLKTCESGLANSRNAILFNWKARVHMLLSEFALAHTNLRESLVYYPTNIEALANVGHYSFYNDKYELSLRCFERINQLCANLGKSSDALAVFYSSTAQLCNNLALSNFYCGNYTRVMPLFQRALLNSPSQEVTSDIWYNISFVPLSFGARQLASACLRLALKNDTQNEDAINNLGCLKYNSLINDSLHYANRQEYWSSGASTRTSQHCSVDLTNRDDQRRHEARFDEAEAYFCGPQANDVQGQGQSQQPERLFNMAVLKRRRGQLQSSMLYCELYREFDDNNHTIRRIMDDIRELVSHDN